MPARFDIGIKIYDYDWFLNYGLSYDEAAALLKNWGTTFVMCLNQYLPMPESDKRMIDSPEMKQRFAEYSDRKFRDALAKQKIAYYAAVCLFFDPPFLQAHPEWIPIGNDGKPMEQIDWYMGIPPSADVFVEQRLKAIEAIMQELHPDGLQLMFARWPGFWELWTPNVNYTDFPEYSYDRYTLERFCRETGLHIPNLSPRAAAQWIETNARMTWTEWKCRVIYDVLEQVKRVGQRYNSNFKIMLNTLPLGREYDDAQNDVFGQRIEMLRDVVDIYEVMTYHQIRKLPIEWIPKIGREIKERSLRKVICTLQTAPLYIDGMHTHANRSRTLEVTEFEQTVKLLEAESGIEGLAVCEWSDLLHQVYQEKDTRRVDILRWASNLRNPLNIKH